jgi:small-conductance mechanosensitive channel
MTNFISNINLNTQFLGNSLLEYAKAIGLFIVLLIVFKVVQYIILKRLGKLAEKTETDIDDTLIEITKSLKPPFYYFLAFYFAVQFLTLNALTVRIISGVLVVWVVYQVIKGIQILLNYILHKKFVKEDDKGSKAAIGYISMILKIVLWAIGLLLILSNLGIDVTSLIAGLGIGGIAIAFALQNILSDLFSSFAIYFDKPFVVGDFIAIGKDKGTVEKIGIKTTRIRSTMGEEIVISNQELTSARVNNYGRIAERRNVFTLGVTYETPTEKLKLVPAIVRSAVKSTELTRFDRVHFSSFGDFSLNFDVSYYVQSNEYSKFMDVKQEVNIKIKDGFEKEGIEFAYPTQKLFLSK